MYNSSFSNNLSNVFDLSIVVVIISLMVIIFLSPLHSIWDSVVGPMVG